jgi:2-polyprenyl-3-methyl-5-hydroxy-6-metoxy-1,4-benzoquinol methylase
MIDWNVWNAEQAEKRVADRVALTDRVLSEFAALDIAPGSRVLDVGIGAGFTTDALSPRYDYLGLDLSEQGVALARSRNPRATLEAIDFLKWSAPASEFDAVVCVDTLPYFKEEQDAAIAKIARALKPGAPLLITAVNPFIYSRLAWVNARGEKPYGKWLTGAEVVALLERNGFDVEKSATIVPAGDRGWLRALNSRRLKALAGAAYVRALESAGLGQYLLVTARKALGSYGSVSQTKSPSLRS